MNELSPELTEAIRAVDALNSWVRSESYRRQHVSSPKHAVYWLKRCALKAASEAGCAYSRVVATIAECHRCNGSGRFVNWDGYDFCVSRGPVGWKDHACATCDALYHRSQGRPDIFDAFPVPHELLQDKNIRAWIERRGKEHLTALGIQPAPAEEEVR